jgi:putative DNA primase/helicase
VCSDKTVNAVLRLISIDQRIASRVDDWDQDPWLLGTPDGTVDLRTGTLRQAQPDDRVTKCTKVTPAGDCRLWLTVLDRATSGDKALQVWLQRFFGYCLSGSTREEILAFFHGPGGSGKGAVMHTVTNIFGDYHRVTGIETITESKHDRHPAEVAALQGARLVTCSETKRGKRWAESRIKQWTGSDPLSARFMNQNFFDFIPTFKLAVAGNYRPSLRPDSAMRRRVRLVPFSFAIPDMERDTSLKAKLEKEWPGILGWMIAGCVTWQKHGLETPQSILDASEDYMREEAEDVLAMWIAEWCVIDPTAVSNQSDLYSSFRRYAELAGEEKIPSSAMFGKDMSALGFKSDRTMAARKNASGSSLYPRRPFRHET